MNRCFTFLLILLVPLLAIGQPQGTPPQPKLPQVSADGIRQARESALERDSILIGDQIWWTLPLPADAWEKALTQEVLLPELPNVITEGVEALSIELDSVQVRKKIKDMSARIRLTSFDSGAYSLPYLPLYLKRLDGAVDTLWFKGPILNVTTIPIDTTTYEAYGLKGQATYPVTAGEILKWAAIVIGVLGIIALIIWVIKRRKHSLPLFQPNKPKEPAHLVALRSLDKIKAQELWKNSNKVKVYYTQLTDTLRTYLRDRWNIQAMEQTSQEMLESLEENARKGEPLDKKAIEPLREMLSVSDLVKFAKYTPTEQDNVDSLMQAVRFVTVTAQSDSETPAQPDPEPKKD